MPKAPPAARKLKASRLPMRLFSAPPPERPWCEPPPRWTIGLRSPEIALPDPMKIEPYLRFFTENPGGRKLAANWLKRSGRWRWLVASSLKAHRLPRDIEALVFVESGFSPTAVSRAGAVGLWQLMPQTAKDLELHVGAEVDERRNVYKSTAAATKHLADLFAKFGSWDLAFAAYDFGAKKLARRMEEYGAMDYWSLAAIDGALPQETVEYVPKVLAFAILLRNLDRFGFDDLPIDPPFHTNALDVPPGTSFALVARAAGTSVLHLHEINPDILGNWVPYSGRFARVHVPSSGLARAKAMLPHLLDGKGDGLETEVPESFDWSRDDVDAVTKPPTSASKGAAKDAKASDSKLAEAPRKHGGKTCAVGEAQPPAELAARNGEGGQAAGKGKKSSSPPKAQPAKRLPS